MDDNFPFSLHLGEEAIRYSVNFTRGIITGILNLIMF